MFTYISRIVPQSTIVYKSNFEKVIYSGRSKRDKVPRFVLKKLQRTCESNSKAVEQIYCKIYMFKNTVACGGEGEECYIFSKISDAITKIQEGLLTYFVICFIRMRFSYIVRFFTCIFTATEWNPKSKYHL